jgi:hypothetical protein
MRIALCLLLLLGVTAAAPDAAKRPSSLALVEKGLARAAASGRLTNGEAAAYRAVARRAADASRAPGARGRNLAGALADVAAQWRRYEAPRALTLFTMLELNLERPPGPRDAVAKDGVVYRLFGGHGYVFHPLANAIRLNRLVSRGDAEAAQTLAASLAARAVPAGSGTVWEYSFRFGRGRPGWTSGMAQAVTAQALARTGNLLSDEEILALAERAYRSIPGRLVFLTEAGPWIRLYHWSRLTVLNAQLQAVLSLGDYAEITGDTGGESLARRLEEAAAALLPRFDTGAWSRYALAGRESPLTYHEYVIDLLRALAVRTGDQTWRARADRFSRYEQEPPVLKPGPGGPVLYPVPRDGYRDEARLRLWISKVSRVTLRIGGRSRAVTLGRGWHTLVWSARGRNPGTYRPRVTAVDPAGNRARVVLPFVIVRHARAVPTVGARVDPPATLVWASPDEWTPWLELTVELRSGAETRELELGRRPRKGRARLRLADGRWQATLVAVASSGRKRTVSLGYVPK